MDGSRTMANAAGLGGASDGDVVCVVAAAADEEGWSGRGRGSPRGSPDSNRRVGLGGLNDSSSVMPATRHTVLQWKPRPHRYKLRPFSLLHSYSMALRVPSLQLCNICAGTKIPHAHTATRSVLNQSTRKPDTVAGTPIHSPQPQRQLQRATLSTRPYTQRYSGLSSAESEKRE